MKAKEYIFREISKTIEVNREKNKLCLQKQYFWETFTTRYIVCLFEKSDAHTKLMI